MCCTANHYEKNRLGSDGGYTNACTNACANDDIPIVYGLATVYSSVLGPVLYAVCITTSQAINLAINKIS